MSEELLTFNGINGATGEYGLPAMTNAQLSKFIEGEEPPENLDDLKRKAREREAVLTIKEGHDPKNLAEAGWGIVFSYDADPSIKEALSELIELRRKQAGAYFKIYEGSDGYRLGESKAKFLQRIGGVPGPADPEKVPYYLLIVGSPKYVPFMVQYQLDVQYAVGRIHFDSLQEYANYASSVVAAEMGKIKRSRQIALFGVANSDDKATDLSATRLMQPMLEMLQKKPDWQVSAYMREEATKSQLSRLLGGDQTPALLFTASHGMEFPQEDSRQVAHQGALLCQDWPGPKAFRGKIPQDFYLAGDDIGIDANLSGLIAIHFACYGAGTPLWDEFSKQAFKTRKAIAPYPFVSGLSRQLTGHACGGALAVIGHIERAWGFSFAWPGSSEEKQIATFESAFARLLNGHPVGSAFEYFNQRYAEISTTLVEELEEIDYGRKYDPYELASLWTANNDARDYVVIGDPAVRLPVVDVPDQSVVVQSTIEVKTVTGRPIEPPWSPEDTPIPSFTRPSAITEGDWQKTPPAVQKYMADLEARVSKAKSA
jgi:hypothetical protein